MVQIFKDSLESALEYKKNPPKDDFMAEMEELGLLDDLDDKKGSGKKSDGDEEF